VASGKLPFETVGVPAFMIWLLEGQNGGVYPMLSVFYFPSQKKISEWKPFCETDGACFILLF
jgi:hypothetical protein